jgi:hypothetical protein
MAVPILTPTSTTSSIVLASAGNVDNVNSSTNLLPFGIYTSSDFKEGAKDQVAYTYKKLGGDVLDVELTEYQVYAAYEEATLEYSYIVNVHQAKNVLGDLLGNTTGSFDNDGVLKTDSGSDEVKAQSSEKIQLSYPRNEFEYSRRVAHGAANAANIGGVETVYSASLDLDGDTPTQDYDVQTLISSSAATSSSLDFSDSNLTTNKIGSRKLLIRKVYYKSPQAMWRFFGYYGGLNTVGNLANYGQYADDTTFELIPTWQNKLQARSYEDALYTRYSHWAYEIKNNRLRLFPPPVGNGPTKIWVEFSVKTDAWHEESDRKSGTKGVNNMNTLPFENVPYENINSIGKQWIRRFALSLAKEMLGQIRSKFGAIPIPGADVTLNGSDLLSQSKDEQEKLREELKTVLDELTYAKLAEKDAAVADSVNKTMASVPVPIFVG